MPNNPLPKPPPLPNPPSPAPLPDVLTDAQARAQCLADNPLLSPAALAACIERLTTP